jgi:hypothetical protein
MADQAHTAGAHFGDPCIRCNTPHDEVEPGPCPGREPILTVTGYCSLGVRWDGVVHYRYRLSDGTVHEVHRHVSEHAPYYHFGRSGALVNPPPYAPELRAAKATGGSHDN